MAHLPLTRLQASIDGLVSEDGRYVLRCSQTGERPVPAETARFADRDIARRAALAAELYRAKLREYDPRLPHCEIIVCEEIPPGETVARTRDPAQAGRYGDLSAPVLDGSVSGTAPWNRRQFAHDVAKAVFETIVADGIDALEASIMDEYLRMAGSVTDPDELCVGLLERLSAEIQHGLEASEQHRLIRSAAARLERAETVADPIDETLCYFERLRLLEGHAHTPSVADASRGTCSTVVQLSGYALSPAENRLPVLPIVLELSRRQPERLPTSIEAHRAVDGWRLSFGPADSADRGGLANAPITTRC
jgi:hypothetical protein